MAMSENKQQPMQDSTDSLAALHRMSTTAGAAWQEYVAINMAAVVTLVLGLASALVLLSPTLLVVPAAAIVFGIVALRQISHSNGTQTGRVLAWLGILIGLGMAGFIGAREVRAEMANRAEQQAIKSVVAELGNAVMAGDYDKALTLFSDRFQKRPDMTPKVFAARWAVLTNNAMYGKMTGFRTNDRVEAAATLDADGARGGVSMLVVTFEKTDQVFRREIYFRQEGGVWKVDSIPMLFPMPESSKQQPPAPNLPGQPPAM
jgi:hypothetical protein